MANREALRELQARLAERLQQARGEVRSASWLAVECARLGFLFPLTGAGEIFNAAVVLPLPHTQPWFAGVANLRGGLHGVVDLAVFLGLAARPARRETHLLVVLNPALGSQCALLVQGLAGLRHAHQLQPEAAEEGPRPEFAGPRWRDEQGRLWQEIDLAALARNEQFQAIAR